MMNAFVRLEQYVSNLNPTWSGGEQDKTSSWWKLHKFSMQFEPNNKPHALSNIPNVEPRKDQHKALRHYATLGERQLNMLLSN